MLATSCAETNSLSLAVPGLSYPRLVEQINDDGKGSKETETDDENVTAGNVLHTAGEFYITCTHSILNYIHPVNFIFHPFNEFYITSSKFHITLYTNPVIFFTTPTE